MPGFNKIYVGWIDRRIHSQHGAGLTRQHQADTKIALAPREFCVASAHNAQEGQLGLISGADARDQRRWYVLGQGFRGGVREIGKEHLSRLDVCN
ncbi:hypothetical protein D0B54_07580 [Solimonas sp. K1W22B-7]|nr:hypothetical protein D0B54_07580 [Solimonas sp. K1W22B-7]